MMSTPCSAAMRARRVLSWLADRIVEHASRFLVGAAAVGLFALALLPGLRVDAGHSGLVDADDEHQRRFDRFLERFGSPSMLFVMVEGVQAGQTLVMDAEVSPGRFSFFVIDDCAANACIDAFEFDENSNNVGRYVAAADGDVLVVVEAMGADMDREFAIEFSVSSN